LSGGVPEPDSDGGDVDGPSVDEVSLVVAGRHSAVAAEFVDGPFDGVAVLVDFGVELGRAAALGAFGEAAFALVDRLGDGRLDAVLSQVLSDLAGGVCLVGQHPIRSGPGLAAGAPGDADIGHDRGERERIVALPGAGDPADRPAPGVRAEVDLRAQSAPAAPERLPVLDRFSSPAPILVVRPIPLCPFRV